MKNIKIRKAALNDLKIIQDLSLELFKHDSQWDVLFNLDWSHDNAGEKFFRKVLTSKSKVCFLAEIDNEIVGYLAAAILPSLAWRPVKRTEITNLFVKETSRGMSIGTKLVENFFNWSKVKGVRRVTVVAHANNSKALLFYKKNKFLPFLTTLEAEIK